MMAATGEMGIPSVLSAEGWGFFDVLFKGERFAFPRRYEHWVLQNILFKISFPAEFHAQTAVECAMKLHAQVADRLDEIDHIELGTQSAAVRIISKDGPLHNPADRDHCLQYMVAVPLIHGRLDADCYENSFAADPRIDQLRQKMRVHEEPRFTEEYYDLDKRAIGNSVQVFFKDNTQTEKIVIDYPIGHRRRRADGIPLLEQKFREALATCFSQEQTQAINDLCLDQKKLESTAVHDFVDMLVIPK
jgi:2-methylcitrate dehydratase